MKADFFRQVAAPVEPLRQKLLKEDCQLFSKLFISCQSRECNLHEFFQYENQAIPPALSEGGRLYRCQKAQLISILDSHVTPEDMAPDSDVLIVDVSAPLPPKRGKTFEGYALLDFLPVIQSYSSKNTATHLVFDVYTTSSLKADTRVQHGQGGRRKVTGAISLDTMTTKLSCSNSWQKRLPRCLQQTWLLSQKDLLSSAPMGLAFRGWTSALMRKLTAASLCMRSMLWNMGARPLWSRQMTQILSSLHWVSSTHFRVWGCSAYGWHLAKARACDGSALMTCVNIWAKKRSLASCSFMPSQAVTPYQPSGTRTRRWLGKRGTSLLRPPLYSPNWVSTLS